MSQENKDKRLIQPSDGSRAIGAYSPALMYDNLIFISGQIASDLDASIDKQTEQCLEKIRSLVESAGANMDNVLRCQVFMEDIEDFSVMNEIYSTYFKKPYPTRLALGGLNLPKGSKIEISAVAYKQILG